MYIRSILNKLSLIESRNTISNGAADKNLEEIARLYADGQSLTKIAEKLGLTRHLVKSYLEKRPDFQKLQISHKDAIARWINIRATRKHWDKVVNRNKAILAKKEAAKKLAKLSKQAADLEAAAIQAAKAAAAAKEQLRLAKQAADANLAAKKSKR